ncbi:MAG: HupE/UreJ family protein [Alcanivoracaceae bacterium]|nr:HupE/UreJ family protein [Alcanivoracaceae bacterium]
MNYLNNIANTRFKFFTTLFCLISINVQADIVKPALVEISVYTNGSYKIEVRASIEAMLTGINSQYRNTQDAPNAQSYDKLRVMQSGQLENEFAKFHSNFTQIVKLKFDEEPINLKVVSVSIPEPGYTKVPRISIITLEGQIKRTVEKISWYYPEKFADNAVRVRQVNEVSENWHWSHWQWLRDNQWSDPFSLNEVFHKEPFWSVIEVYTKAGFYHILPKGKDHILFILGLFLLSIKLRPLLWQVTMFTIAHSITLSLAMLDIFSLPANIIEPLIALSIAYIGLENIFTTKIKPRRLIIIFIFGLLHGMGFASVLIDFGMPKNSFTTALISFNVGVELGQLTIIALAFVLIGYWFRHKLWYRNIIVIPISLLIGLIGLYWTYDRIQIPI